MMFEITAAEQEKIDQWLHNVVFPPIIAEQRASDYFSEDLLITDEQGRVWPYEGAIGGGLTYCFTPTSLGIVLVVKYGDQELNLTDYDSW